jgi:hypothetical protein
MEFQLSKHVRMVVDFEVGEQVRITGFNKKVDGVHTVKELKPWAYGASQSLISVLVSGYDNWLDLGWIEKIN